MMFFAMVFSIMMSRCVEVCVCVCLLVGEARLKWGLSRQGTPDGHIAIEMLTTEKGIWDCFEFDNEV